MTTLRDNPMSIDTGLAFLVNMSAPEQDLYNQDVAERPPPPLCQPQCFSNIATGSNPTIFRGNRYPLSDGSDVVPGRRGVLDYATNRWMPADSTQQPLLNDTILFPLQPGHVRGGFR